MNKLIASLTLIAPLCFTPAAFANTAQPAPTPHSQQARQALTKIDVLDSNQGYELESIVANQPRRSPLFAHILDTVAKSVSLAKIDNSASS